VKSLVLVLGFLSSAAYANEGLRYGQRVTVNGQRGQVISQGTNQHRGAVVETRSWNGQRSTHTLSGYDMVFRRQIHSSAAHPSFVLPNVGAIIRSQARR